MPQTANRQMRGIKVRIAILAAAMLFGIAAIARGAWDLGVVRSDELNDLAKEQYIRRITLPAHRGMIVDRHGQELAVEVAVDSVYANPKKVRDRDAAADAVAGTMQLDVSDVRKKLTSSSQFVWLKRRISPALAKEVRALNLEGIDTVKESKRYYPNRSLAAHLTGFAGIDSVGLEGIELKFDEQLRGRKDAVLGLRDARGRVIFANKIFGPDGVMGATVELTIDRGIQYIVEQELAATISAFNAKAGHVVVMDPHTGEIQALASWPTYNLNTIQDSTSEDRRNRAALDVFEPGSTFKVFTLAAVLNAGVVRPDDLIFCERGRMEIFDRIIHDDHRDGWLNPTQCIKRSSNICFAKMALKLGKQQLYHNLRRFGFGERTYIDLPFEAQGALRHYKKWYDVDCATIAYGQGVGVTGLQMATALSAIANGGMLMRPLIVKRIISSDGETLRTFSPQVRRRVISRYTARLDGDMMTAVTETGGTGTQGALDGFLVAGKTGTAQKSEGVKGYSEDKWTSSFISFVPADKPRLVISVIIDEPLISHYGGEVAAPAARRIADQILRYMGVAPRKASPKSAGQIVAEASPPDPEEMSLSPEPSSGFFTEEATLNPGPDQVVAPDLRGMSMIEAMESIAVHDLRPLFMGTGFAVEQAPPPGDLLNRGDFIQVNFRAPGQEQVQTKPSSESDNADRS